MRIKPTNPGFQGQWLSHGGYQTCQCNIQKKKSVAKIENFIGNIDSFNIFAKILIVGTR